MCKFHDERLFRRPRVVVFFKLCLIVHSVVRRKQFAVTCKERRYGLRHEGMASS